MYSGNSNKIPHFLKASTPDRLMLEMLKNNLENSTEFRYFDIQQTKDGKWITWFIKDISNDIKNLINKG